MVKLTPQQCFDLACDKYEKAKGIIADLTVKAKELSDTFNGDIAMRQFDFIVQAILLNLAVEDKEFCELEKVFIKEITEYADILVTVNKLLKEEYPIGLTLPGMTLTASPPRTRTSSPQSARTQSPSTPTSSPTSSLRSTFSMRREITTRSSRSACSTSSCFLTRLTRAASIPRQAPTTRLCAHST